jgi:hypothetical protein
MWKDMKWIDVSSGSLSDHEQSQLKALQKYLDKAKNFQWSAGMKNSKKKNLVAGTFVRVTLDASDQAQIRQIADKEVRTIVSAVRILIKEALAVRAGGK